MKKKSPGKMKLFFRFLKGSLPLFLLAILSVTVSILLSYVTPKIFGVTIDSVIGAEPFDLPAILIEKIEALGGRAFLIENLLWIAVASVVVVLLSSLASVTSTLTTRSAAEKMAEKLRKALYAHIQKLPYQWHTSVQTGDIIQRCTSDVDLIRRTVQMQIMECFRVFLMLIIGIVLLLQINVKLTLIALIFLPITLFYSFFFYARISKRFRSADEAEGTLTAKAQENFTGVRVVRAFGREAYEIANFNEKNDVLAKTWVNYSKISGLFWGVGDLFSGLQMLAVLVFSAFAVVNGEITVGQFLIFASYNSMLIWPVRNLGRILSEMSKMSVSLERLQEIFDAKIEEDAPDACEEPDLNGDIVFEHVTFGYGKEPVLKDVSFTIPHGSTFAILGGTASGKSTLVHLINRLYDLPPEQGKITINGHDIQKVRRTYLRKKVGLVLQESFLFSKTVAENVLSATPEKSLEDVREVARIANVDDAIMSFADQYDTILGERGVTLSGGQKQRVAIARTLIQKTPIIIFDDSLSAVDSETDAKIRRSLKENLHDATTILISHRITTLMHADRILVLDDGAVEDIGTHQELVAREGLYQRIFTLQSSIQSDLKGGPECETK